MSILMSEPFLILHKVRGEPAFDIAEKMDMSHAGYDEPWWIIPTSGHRAYPYRDWPLDLLEGPAFYPQHIPWAFNPELDAPYEWPLLPDHYAASEKRSMLATAASDILSLMGIRKAPPQEPVKRRVIP